MNNRDLEQKIQELVQQRKRRKRWYKLTAVLAAAAMVVTAGSLILPAMTMEKAPEPLKCQLDLHAHEESCYGDGGELLCGYADFVVHEHDASCYDEEGVLICPLEEIKAHTHSISCYEETRVLTCGMEEGEGHTHNASCYGKSTESTCGFEEKPSHVHTGHIHNSDCYQITRTLTCGQAETRDHTHTSDCYETTTQLICDLDTGCYDEQGNLICGLSEGEGHTYAQDCYPDVLLCGKEEVPAHSHSDACYQVVPELVCGKEEIILHTHTPACYDRGGNLICGQIEVREHVHDETCLPAKPETIATPAPSEDGEEVKPSLSPSVEPEGDRSTPAPAIDYEDPEAPQSPAPGQEGEVEASPTPEPEWKPSPAPEPEEEEKSQASPSPAPEEGGEESAFPVMSGSSWAIVKKEESQVKENAVMLFSRLFSFAAPRADGSYDFSNDITSVTVERQQDSQWIPSGTFMDGDTIRVTIQYTIPEGKIAETQKTMHYQLPDGIALQEIETGRVTSGEDEVGDYTIGTNGLIIITFDEGFNTSEAFAGSIMFQGYVSYADAGDGGQIVFGGSGTTITVTPGEETYDLTAAKTAIYADGTISYTITVSTKEGTDGSITISDHFQHQTNYAYVTYSENSFVITKSDGTNVTGYTPAVNNNGAGSFRIENLPALQAGESYTIKYTAAIDLDQSPGDKYGYLEVSNTVTAQDNTNSASASARVTVFNTLLTKTGSYNEETQEITWTITINTGGRDIGGYELSDVLTLPNGTTEPITSATLNGAEITLPYTFPAGSIGTYTITYTTKVEYPEAGDTLTNTARLGEYSASTGVTIPGDDPGEGGQTVLTKTASSTGEAGTYADDVTMDVSGDSVIYYKISVSDYGDTTGAVITDTLPDGVTLVEGSIRLVVDNLHTSYPEDSYYLQSAVLNENTLTFTMVRMNQISSFDIYYAVSVPGEDGTYTNTANWGDLTDSTTTTVNYTRPVVEKTGTAVEEDGETIIRYSVIVNPEGRDLNAGSDTLTLTDELTLSSAAAGAVFRPETVVLYVYDPAAEYGCGEQITGGYTVDYDADSYTITFTIPDSMACVVVYEYAVNRGNAAVEVEINNTATLSGVTAGAGNDQIIIEDQTSSAEVNQAKLRIYKVDAENYTDLLPGAAFEIYRFEQTDDGGYDWIQTILTAQGEDGQYIVGETGYIELNFVEHLTAGSLYNTLYLLNEITAPTGYTASDETYYFVWMEQSATEESTIAAMTETGAVPENFSFETANVVFIPYSTDSAIYVPNESSTTFISVTKQWQGAEGTTLTDGLPESAEVTLYQVSENGKKTKYEADGIDNPVKLTANKNWGYTWKQLPKEDAQGNPVTYTVEETPIPGWEASYVDENGAETTGITKGTIQIINTKQSAFTLPETGGFGPLQFAIAGLPLVGASGVVYLKQRRKRRRGGKTP